MSSSEEVLEGGEGPVEDVLKKDVEESRAKCGDLPKLFTELVIARMLENGYETTPRKVMYILAAALFTKPDEEDLAKVIDVHPLADCFRYRILHEPAYSQVVIEAIKELEREGRIEVKVVPDLETDGTRLIIVKGRRFRSSKKVLKEIMKRARGQAGITKWLPNISSKLMSIFRRLWVVVHGYD